jgi:hypothetical protein
VIIGEVLSTNIDEEPYLKIMLYIIEELVLMDEALDMITEYMKKILEIFLVKMIFRFILYKATFVMNCCLLSIKNRNL